MRRTFVTAATLLGLLTLSASALATESCVTLVNDQERLACYDKLFGKPAPSSEDTATQTLTDTDTVVTETPVSPASLSAVADETPIPDAQESEVRKRIEREDLLFGHTFVILPHRATYILPYTHQRDLNETLIEEVTSGTPYEQTQLDHSEAKFQISLKVPLIENLLFEDANLWFGYTQLSLWQVYNQEISAAFRETNYEPEVFWSLPTDISLPGINIEQFTLGLNHQSNGRGDPLSRSWNRAYAEVLMAHNRWAFAAKSWYRLPEDREDDDNPDILDYMGDTDITAAYKWDDFTLSATTRHSFFHKDSRNSVNLNLSFPLPGRLSGYLEYFNGYGETLIDYNHRNERIGIGFILNNWY